jgi:hypothetical protein
VAGQLGGQTVRRDGQLRRQLSAANGAAALFVTFLAASFSQSKLVTLFKNSAVGGTWMLALVQSLIQFKESGVRQGRLSFRFLPPVFSSRATVYLVIGPRPGVRTDRAGLARSGRARRGWCANGQLWGPREQYQRRCRVWGDALAAPVAHEYTLLIKLAKASSGQPAAAPFGRRIAWNGRLGTCNIIYYNWTTCQVQMPAV